MAVALQVAIVERIIQESMYGLSAGTKKMAVVERWPLVEVGLHMHFRFFFSVCRKRTKIWITSALVSKQGTVIKKGGRSIKVKYSKRLAN